MSTRTLDVLATGTLPSVNLLPPEIEEQRRFKRLQMLMGAAVVGAIAVVAGGYTLVHGGVADAQSQLDAANARHVQLQRQLTTYSNVKAINADVAAHEAMLTSAMGGEVQWSHYLNDLSLIMPDTVWLTQVSGQTGGASATAAGASIGSVKFTGVAMSHDDVATWLEHLAEESGFANPYFSNSTESKIGDTSVVDFSSSVDLTPDAHSGRYTKPAGG